MAQFRKDTHQYLNDGKTIFETVMLADQYGNLVGAANPSGMAVDAFGRARVSNPITLFDSYNRYEASEKYHVANTATATYAFSANASTFSMTVDTTADAQVARESKRVFAYQPGKSLQILNTFIMNEPKTGLRQRVGYFSTQNGIFLEQDGTTISFVKRSYSTGSVVETKVAQASWNLDTLDGSGASGYTLDLTKAQIMFVDVEWLGLGTVRCGFVINGQLIHCHSFHHANIIDAPYMTTACLPIRAEITNTAETAGASTFKIVCASVISEGGYELRGKPRSVGRPANNVFTMATAGVWYPIVSIRLKSDQLDAIALPKNISALAEGNNGRAKYALIAGGTLGGNTQFTSVSSDSSIEYNYVANTITGGTVLNQGFVGLTNQSAASITLQGNLFTYQLQRNSFTSTPEVMTLAMQGGTNSDTGTGSIDWEEVT
jgi:hypothetical protein